MSLRDILVPNHHNVYCNDLTLSGNLNMKGDILLDDIHATNTANSTSASTGALIVDGGAGVVKDLHVGGSLYANGNCTTTNLYYTNNIVSSDSNGVFHDTFGNIKFKVDATTGDTWSLFSNGGSSMLEVPNNPSGTIKMKATTQSTSTSTGALTVNGGVGVAKDLNVGGDVFVQSTTDALSLSTGAVQIAGGVSISKDLVIGGKMRIPLSTKAANSTGVAGEITFDALRLYVCIGDDTWKLVDLASF